MHVHSFDTVNSDIFAIVLISRSEVSWKLNPREMAKLLCLLLMYVNQALVANFNVTNTSFNAIRENKILAKTSEFTVDSLNLSLCHLLSL